MKTTHQPAKAAAVLDAYNNHMSINVISETGTLQFSLSLQNAMNLLENKAAKNSFEIRKNTPDNAERGKPKPAIYGKYLGENVLRIAVAKTNANVKKASDLGEAVDYQIENLESLLLAASAHMTNMETHKKFKVEFFKQFQKTGSGFDI